MYDEKKDFEHHKREVADFYAILNYLKISDYGTGNVLDFGAGQGMHVSFLQEKFNYVTAVDIINYSSLYGGEYFKLIKEKHLRNMYNLELSKASFIQTDGMDLLFKDNLFDASVSFNVFEHIPSPEKGLDELIRVTKPGGIIYITFDPIWTADTGGHFFHRVPEPWAHLIYDEAQYINLLRSDGADESEVQDYKYAMNKVRLQDHLDIIKKVTSKQKANLLYLDSWKGTVDQSHTQHPNFNTLKSAGFTEEELMTRGLKCLIVKSF